MVCQNCKSKEVIAIQDQYFCVSCGQLVTGDAVEIEQGVEPEETPKQKWAPKLKRGRPKAGRLDAPIAGSSSVSSGSVMPDAPRIAPMRSMSDLSTKLRKDEPAPASEETAESLSYASVVGASLHDRIDLPYLGWSIIPATFLALLAGGALFVLTSGQFATVASRTIRAGWPIWGEVIILLALYYFSRSITGPATMFAAVRRADHRPVPSARQLAVAVDSLGARFGFDLLMTLLQLLVCVLIAGLVLVGGVSWPVPDIAQLAALFIGFLILSFIVVGLNLAQGLGRAALTLGQISPGRALVIGWNFFVRHLELVGLHVLSLLLELLLITPIIALVVSALIYLPARWAIFVPFGAIVLVALGGAMVGAGTAVWWAELYRTLVKRYRPGEMAKLLSGRGITKARSGSQVLAWSLATLLVVMAIIWPWLPL